MRWVGGTLAIVFVLLAPWGGPCDRRTRPADPTTSRLSAILGQANESQPGLDDSDRGAGLPDAAMDILDVEDGGEDFDGRIFVGETQESTPTCRGVTGPMDCDRQLDDSGRSARSARLRC